MAPRTCGRCHTARAQIVRPKNRHQLCASCFIAVFEAEIAETITAAALFAPGERVAIGASGGKDSTVLAAVLATLNTRHAWGLDLQLLSIDEGIAGYRDHSLEAVRRNAADLDLPLTVLGYAELYGWSMDQVVAQVGRRGNCTYCGVFRRQALDRGAARLGVAHVVTGHNADDVAETVLMNLLRGDLPRLGRATSIVTATPAAAKTDGPTGVDGSPPAVHFTHVKRSKPLMYAYEKEIVMYAHHRKLDYFSTECVYSPEAFRGSARTLIKNLERVRPESILDVVRSGIDMARMVPDADGIGRGSCASKPFPVVRDGDGADIGGCGGTSAASGGDGDMAEMEARLAQQERAEIEATETEIKLPMRQRASKPAEKAAIAAKPAVRRAQAAPPMQKLGECERCGYLSSQTICKACVLLEGLNKARPRTGIEVGGNGG